MYLNHLQIRVARTSLNLGVRELGKLIEVSRTIISQLENNAVKIQTLRFGDRRNNILIHYFREKGIVFPDQYSVYLIDRSSTSRKATNTITRFELRACRNALFYTQKKFALETNNTLSEIKYSETKDNHLLLDSSNIKNIYNIIQFLKEKGINIKKDNMIEFKNYLTLEKSIDNLS